MAIKAFDGFEGGVTTSTILTGTASLVTTPTRGAWSTYAVRSNPTTTGTGYYTVFGSNGAVLATTVDLGAISYFTFYFYVLTLPASGNEEFTAIRATGGAVAKMELRIDSTGVISAYSGTTLIATGTTVLSLATWYKIQIKCGTGAGAAVEWKVNDAVDGSTTATLTVSATNCIRLGKSTNRNGNSVDFYFDDCIVSDSDYVPAVQVARLIPDADGTYQTFTVGAGSGSHYQIVGQVPPDVSFTTSYLVSPNVIGNAETEALQPASTKYIGGTILAVSPFIIFTRNGSLNGSVLVRVRSGSTNSDSAAASSSTAVAYSSRMMETDPNTGVAWTASGIDGVEVGLVEQFATSANRTKMGSAFLMVAYDNPAPTNSVAPSCTPSSGTVSDTFTFAPGTWTGSPTSYETSVSVDGGAYSVIDTSAGGTPAKTGTQLGGPGTIATRVRAQNAGGWSGYVAGTTLTVTAAGGGRSRLLLMGAT